MLKNTPYCRLLCASASAYYVQLDGHFVTPKPTDKDYKEFINVGFYRPPMAFSKPSTKTGEKINAAILGQTDFGMVLAFRGTLPPTTWTPATLEDWWQDICKIGLVSDAVLPGLVHEGFHTAFMTIWPEIKFQLDNFYKNGVTVPLYITGHSKGGPMASYAAYYAKKLGYPLANVSTFASPCAGNENWAKGYELVVPYQHRYENYLDIVPFLPPNKAFFGAIVPELDYFIDILKKIGFEKELSKFEHFINESMKLDYTPVGDLYYVKQDHSITTPKQSPGLEDLRIAEFIALIMSDVLQHGSRGAILALQTIGHAHTVACGGGYETGVCNIC